MKKVAIDMKAGKTSIYTKMERKMLSDIRDIKKKQYYEEVTEIHLKDMKRTQEFMKFGKILAGYFSLLM